ncbi:hypothetical protein MtrunA17_Chr5g0395441 [Medicago truncatula]|uniref:Transmembrane protein, putative n=1 Tax=Medicago truncatula TaxID=3880 RepID=G7K6G4_MEDTR|nr:transmembrane protein, putative [Medicago truncatula]RHN53398.1 hypothetical protein MtrunA17_Chr5g0395441 [Medicago truncatula]
MKHFSPSSANLFSPFRISSSRSSKKIFLYFTRIDSLLFLMFGNINLIFSVKFQYQCRRILAGSPNSDPEHELLKSATISRALSVSISADTRKDLE